MENTRDQLPAAFEVSLPDPPVEIARLLTGHLLRSSEANPEQAARHQAPQDLGREGVIALGMDEAGAS